MTEYETLPQLLARAYPDGPPADLVPVRLCPVQVFGADECDRCQAPAGYGLMDAASAWSDCNRADGRIYRRDEPWMNRLEHETILVWVTPAEAEKFERVLGDPRGPLPVPHVDRVEVGSFVVRVEYTAFPPEDPDAGVIERPVPIPNDDPACACRIENSGMAVLGVFPDEACPYHGDGELLRDAVPEPQPTQDPSGLVARLRQEARGFVSEAMTDLMLYGQHPAPENPPTGLFDALGGVTPDAPSRLSGIRPGEWSMDRALDWALRTDEAANGPLGRAKWAPAGCICPWPWPTTDGHVRLDCPHYTAPPKPIVGRNPQIGCRKVDASWIHGRPHDCAVHARGTQ